MRSPFWSVVTVAFAMLLAGCASNFTSDVSRFHQLPRPAGETFVIVPRDVDKQGSLEFAQYANQIGSRLAAEGYRPAAQGARPDIRVLVDYDVNDGKTQIRSYSSGFYGGYYSRYYHPWYGYPGGFHDNEIRSYVVYSRMLEMVIEREGGDGRTQRLFEGRVISEGRDNRLPEVMPYMIEAMFQDFPGQSGRTQYVKIPIDGGY